MNNEELTIDSPGTTQSSVLSPQSSSQSWLANIRVTLKPVVNDPPGLAMRDALHNLGYAGVSEVRSGKLIQVYLDANTQSEAEEAVHQMCRRLLANPVIEDYAFELKPIAGDQ
ncbi:MAG TPA: phosphoribosylformylglycinamidine synthase subunit PurS [Chloroflexia bacterium]|nr:phosphoribosylformylglycinamidine synthase subunit PurS [Chloroflexia bacterium]